jgi:hypothetical protein
LAGEQLDYRDGHEGDVDPVRIERRPDGGVRVVVRYPPNSLDRARTRFLLWTAVVVLAGTFAWFMMFRFPSPWWSIPMSLAQLGLTFAIVMLILWIRARCVYVFEANRRDFVVETKGWLFSRRHECLAKHVRDVRVARDRRGRVAAMEIKSANSRIGGMWLVGLGDGHIEAVTTALREGLGTSVAHRDDEPLSSRP